MAVAITEGIPVLDMVKAYDYVARPAPRSQSIQYPVPSLDAGEPRSSGKTYKIDCKIVQGIETDKAKVISKKGMIRVREKMWLFTNSSD